VPVVVGIVALAENRGVLLIRPGWVVQAVCGIKIFFAGDGNLHFLLTSKWEIGSMVLQEKTRCGPGFLQNQLIGTLWLLFLPTMAFGESAIFLKHFQEVLTDHLGIAAFDVVALDEVKQFTVLKQRNGR